MVRGPVLSAHMGRMSDILASIAWPREALDSAVTQYRYMAARMEMVLADHWDIEDLAAGIEQLAAPAPHTTEVQRHPRTTSSTQEQHMNVVAFPTEHRQDIGTMFHMPEPSLQVPDAVLHDLLRNAVSEHRTGAVRTRGSIAHRHHLAIAHAYLDSIELMFQTPDLARELVRCLDDRVFDIRRLAGIAQLHGTRRRLNGTEPGSLARGPAPRLPHTWSACLSAPPPRRRPSPSVIVPKPHQHGSNRTTKECTVVTALVVPARTSAPSRMTLLRSIHRLPQRVGIASVSNRGDAMGRHVNESVRQVGMGAVDLRGSRLIVYSSSHTKDGFWIFNGAVELLDCDATDPDLGEAVLRILDASRIGVSTPTLRRAPSPFTPVLATLGLPSWSAYARGIRHVDIERYDRTLRAMPSHNGSSSEGFIGMSDLVASLDDPAAAELGTAVRTALSNCT